MVTKIHKTRWLIHGRVNTELEWLTFSISLKSSIHLTEKLLLSSIPDPPKRECSLQSDQRAAAETHETERPSN